MARGSRTSAEVVTKFRAHYLKTGNVCAASREAGIASSTGSGLAKEANDDPDFVEAREAIYTRALADTERMMMRAVELASIKVERLLGRGASESTDGLPKTREQLDDMIANAQDTAPGYVRAITDAYRALCAHRRVVVDAQADREPMAVHVFMADGTQVHDVGVSTTEPKDD